MSRTRQVGGAGAVRFDERRHIYSDASGKRLLAVTKVIDVAGLIPRQLKDEEAAARGTAVHVACELYDRAQMDTLRIHLRETTEHETEGYLDGWVSFLKQVRFRIRRIEHRVSDRRHGFAGTLDREGNLNGADTIVDIKSNKSGTVWPTAGLQMAAYAHALRPGKRFGRVAVCLMPDGRYRCVTYPINDLAADLADFLSLIRCARVRERLGLA